MPGNSTPDRLRPYKTFSGPRMHDRLALFTGLAPARNGAEPNARDASLAMTWLGLSFVDARVEGQFRVWQQEQLMPLMRFGTLAAISSWLCGLPGYYVAGNDALVPAAIWVTTITLLLSACMWMTFIPRLQKWVLPAHAIVNFIAGCAVIAIGYLAQPSPGAVSSVLIVLAFFGLTIFRLVPLQGALAVGGYVIIHSFAVTQAYQWGWIDLYHCFYYIYMPVAAYLAGLIVCAQLWRLSREGFRCSVIIAEQRKKLERERAQSEKLLLNVLPKPVAEELKSQPGVIAEQFDSATVLFADIVGFTPLAEKLPPDQLVEMLNQIFSGFDALCDQYGIEKIKTVGDAYMAVSGLTQPSDVHAVDAAEMAIRMLDLVAEMPLAQRHGVKLRIGLASGGGVAGVIGTARFAYDLWGDTVNTAARMESHGVAGRIQVSRSTHALLRQHYPFEHRGDIKVKGKGKTSAWLLERRTASADPTFGAL